MSRGELAAKYSVSLSSETLRSGVIRTPSRRQMHGNRNVYDAEKCCWIPSSRPVVKKDERHTLVQEQKVASEVFKMLYTDNNHRKT